MSPKQAKLPLPHVLKLYCPVQVDIQKLAEECVKSSYPFAAAVPDVMHLGQYNSE
jgi:hypothetical protein